MTLMMKGVIEEGTGRSAKGLKIPAAGKTGTTDRNRDAWFIGYTPEIVAGVWVGHDQKDSLGKGGTGGKFAAPIWLDFMTTATEGNRNRPVFTMPE
jgi:penicillin-binding protein 1A